LKEGAALPTVFLRDLDPHQAQGEELPQEVVAERARFVHLAHVRPYLFAREFAHSGLEQRLVLAQRGQRPCSRFGLFGWHISRAYSTAASAHHCRPCDPATPRCVTYPRYVLTPSRSAACLSQAASRPHLASSSK